MTQTELRQLAVIRSMAESVIMAIDAMIPDAPQAMLCEHENRQDVSTMGSDKKVYFCPDCRQRMEE